MRTPYVYTPTLTPEQNEATTPRVHKNYVISPRVQTLSDTQDATEFIYPEREILNEQMKEPETPPSTKCKRISHADCHESKSYYKDPNQMQETFTATESKIQGAKQSRNNPSNNFVK